MVASRVGRDTLGEEALGEIRSLGLSTAAVQQDERHATGVVKVEVDAKGCARFEIEQPSAWDFLEVDSRMGSAGALRGCSLFRIAGAAVATEPGDNPEISWRGPKKAIRIFDVNLRAPFFSAGVLGESMKLADIVKLNDEEVPQVTNLIGLVHSDEKSSARQLMQHYQLKLVCVTRGARGSLLVTKDEFHEQAGIAVKVADTVGAGDAFTAALVHDYLRGADLQTMNRAANRVGAWVASEHGPTPRPKGSLWSVLETFK